MSLCAVLIFILRVVGYNAWSIFVALISVTLSLTLDTSSHLFRKDNLARKLGTGCFILAVCIVLAFAAEIGGRQVLLEPARSEVAILRETEMVMVSSVVVVVLLLLGIAFGLWNGQGKDSDG
jgi:hypothetical protein